MTNKDFIVFFPECSLSVDDIWPDKIGEWNLLDSFEVIGAHDSETYR
jgi:hypothetical protein